MRILRDGVDPDIFFHELEATPRRVLLLDYDGTLAPFRMERDQAVPYPGVREVLERILAAGHTQVVLISGRWTEDLLPLLGLSIMPEIWGSHGWERLKSDGGYEAGRMSEGVIRGLAQADAVLERMGLGPRTEQKPGCLALHWRGLEKEEARNLREGALDELGVIAKESGLELHDFDGGLECRVPGRNKGYVVNTLLSEIKEPSWIAAYLGDDRTDEDAFRALGDRGLSILVRPELRETAAHLWIHPPEELLIFLQRWDEAARKGD